MMFKRMYVPLWLCILVVILIVVLIFNNAVTKSKLKLNSVVFKDFDVDTKMFNNKVKYICLVHSVFSGLFNRFTEEAYSHSSVGIWDTSNNFILLGGTTTQCVTIDVINTKNLKQIEKDKVMFIDTDGWNYILDLNTLTTPKIPVHYRHNKQGLRVIDIIKYAYKYFTKVQYSLLGLNCHYRAIRVYNKFTPKQYNKNTRIGTVDNIFKIFSEITSPEIKSYESRYDKETRDKFINSINDSNRFVINNYVVNSNSNSKDYNKYNHKHNHTHKH